MSDILGISVSESIITLANILKRKPVIRKRILIISGLLTFFTIIAMILNSIFITISDKVFPILLIIGIPSLLLFYTSLLSYINVEYKTLNDHLKILSKEREELSEKIDKENNVMDVIRINLNQLSEYYTINKAQAKKSFSFSVLMIITGLIVIIVMIFLWFHGKVGLNLAIISGLSGVIAEFIGATSLFLYKENSKQIQMFFDKLSYLQHIMLAVELTERLDDEKKSEQVSKIISSLIQNTLSKDKPVKE
jgi:uncharacterized membrane protein (DUF106 family)